MTARIVTHDQCLYWHAAEASTPIIASLGYGQCRWARSLAIRPVWLGDTALVLGSTPVVCAAFVARPTLDQNNNKHEADR